MKVSALALLALLPLLPLGVIRYYGLNAKAIIFAIGWQAQTGLHGFYGLGLLMRESLGTHPAPGYVQLGYFRALQLKFIYLTRFVVQDNYIFTEWLQRIHDSLLAELQASNAPVDDETVFEIPTFDFASSDPSIFLNEFVKKGRPAIIKNVTVEAMNWTPDSLAKRFPNFMAKTRCISGRLGTKVQSLHDYVFSRNSTEVCYFDNNAELFEQHPELLDEMQIWKVAEHMAGKQGVEGTFPKGYLFSQIFMSVHASTGALYHCANFNNLFYMIHGSKKWTFVDPSNSFLMYPMYNNLMRDAKSFLTWHVMHAPNSSAIIEKHFPLYRYCPKYTAVLEQGDLLINPPWNWHMVENFGVESIGIATRWQMNAAYPYNNGLFSFQQFISPDFWKFLYSRAEARITGRPGPYNATSHQTLDEQVNFGRHGSVYKDPRAKDFVSDMAYDEYLRQLGLAGGS